MSDKPTTTAAKPSPGALWIQAEREVMDRYNMAVTTEMTRAHREELRERYRDLMTEHGHLVERKPGDDPNLPCGWPGKRVSDA